MKVIAVTLSAIVAVLWSRDIASAQTEDKQWNVAIFIFHDVQIIDYTGPYEVFVNASANNHARFKIFTVAQTASPVKTIGGMTVLPAHTFETMPKADILVVPGGWGVYAERKRPEILNWLRKTASNAQVTLSVCNGAFFLAAAGLLDGLRATTTAGAQPRLKAEVPSLTIVPEARFVDNGRIVTSAGLSAGIDAAIHVVSKVLGPGWAQRVAVDMEYDWRPDSGYSRAVLADRLLPPPWMMPEGLREPSIFKGDRDHWESRTTVRDPLTPAMAFEQVLGLIEKAVTRGIWSNVAVGPTVTELRREWRFRDAGGELWTASVSVTSTDRPPTLVLAVQRHSKQ